MDYELLKQHINPEPKRILDVGTGLTALPHSMRSCGFHVTAIDNIKDYWPTDITNRHYHVIDDDIRNSKLTGHWDVITCISVLEHIVEYKSAIKSMFNLLSPGGYLIISFPYNERKYCKNVYALPDSSVVVEYPFETQAFSRIEVDGWLKLAPFEIICQTYWNFFDGEYWTCGELVAPPVKVNKEESHQMSCMLLRRPLN
jgi:SAM-dependent methyltransferase